MEEQIWHFPSTDGGTEDGINDAGIKTFEGDIENSLARECIQNSLDAKNDGLESPVCVKFERFETDTCNIPGYKELKDIMGRAKTFFQIQDNTEQLYETAVKMLNNTRINILKISDYNTTGLTGKNDEDKTGSWYKLLRAVGVNSMTGDGGGSFGIGKSAPFAASTLRTVFYSTLNADNNVAFQGNSRLSSFRNSEGDIRRGIGQFGTKKDNGQKGVSSIRNNNNIPTIFQRDRQGTDIFIIGYTTANSDWAKSLLVSVLNNFWMAIYENSLEVDIIDNGNISYKIDKNTLDDLINNFTKDDSCTKLYYNAILEPTKKFQEELPNLGTVNLYIRLGMGPKHIQCMRRPLMETHIMKRLKVMPDDFVGVFIARGKQINALLRNLEPPTHDDWDINRGDEESKRAFREARKWVISSLKELSGERDRNPEEIPDLSYYLPENIDQDALNDSASSFGDKADLPTERETFDQNSSQKQDNSIPGFNIIERHSFIRPGSSSDEEAEKHHKHKGRKSGKKSGATYNPDGNTKYVDTSNMAVRIYEIKRNNKRVYIVNIFPDKDERGDMRITAQADDNIYAIDISRAYDQNGKEYGVENSEIKDIELKSGQKTQLTLELVSNRRYVLGIE